MSQKVEKLGLVERILNILKLDDAGKVSKFFAKEKRECTRAIEKLEMNKKNMAANHKSNLQDYQDKLEDAQEAYEDAKLLITPEDVTTNAAMTSFSDIYWSRIDDAASNVKSVEDSIEELKKHYKEALEDLDEQIGRYKSRISIIDEKK